MRAGDPVFSPVLLYVPHCMMFRYIGDFEGIADPEIFLYFYRTFLIHSSDEKFFYLNFLLLITLLLIHHDAV